MLMMNLTNEIFTIRIFNEIPLEIIDKVDTLIDSNECFGKKIDEYISDALFFNFEIYNTHKGGFCVVCENGNNEIIGFLMCLKDIKNEKRYMHSDLKVREDYRRMHIASKMLKATISEVVRLGGGSLCCTVHPKNIPSINLHEKLGFVKTELKEFANYIENTDNWMNYYEMTFETNKYSIFMDFPRDFYFIERIYDENKTHLDFNIESVSELRKEIQEQADTRYFTVLDGATPCAFVKITGFDTDTVWIEVIAVLPNKQNQGIGTFALKEIEAKLRIEQKHRIKIKVLNNNARMCKLLEKLNYRSIDDESMIFEKIL